MRLTKMIKRASNKSFSFDMLEQMDRKRPQRGTNPERPSKVRRREKRMEARMLLKEERERVLQTIPEDVELLFEEIRTDVYELMS